MIGSDMVTNRVLRTPVNICLIKCPLTNEPRSDGAVRYTGATRCIACLRLIPKISSGSKKQQEYNEKPLKKSPVVHSGIHTKHRKLWNDSKKNSCKFQPSLHTPANIQRDIQVKARLPFSFVFPVPSSVTCCLLLGHLSIPLACPQRFASP